MSRLPQPSLDSTVFVAEGARLVGEVRIEAEANIWYNAVIRADLPRSISVPAPTSRTAPSCMWIMVFPWPWAPA